MAARVLAWTMIKAVDEKRKEIRRNLQKRQSVGKQRTEKVGGSKKTKRHPGAHKLLYPRPRQDSRCPFGGYEVSGTEHSYGLGNQAERKFK